MKKLEYILRILAETYTRRIHTDYQVYPGQGEDISRRTVTVI